MEDYESVLLVKNEVFIYKIPPLTTNKGYKASDWKLDQPEWTGRLKLTAKGLDCVLKLEDKNTGELFAKCPVDKYPGVAVEAVTDSSRYFVIRLQDDDGRNAFIGMGFADRSDSFDLNVALQDHFKWVEKSQDTSMTEENKGPSQFLGFKDGETIKINVNIGKKGGSSRPRTERSAASSGGILLPPPPGGVKLTTNTASARATPSQPVQAKSAAPSAGDNWIQF
ncbi:NECAP-like protein CG9132 [Galendromus occidentalis]|uniref:NECAP-like protein CG9132 n=1 Tax=Galendromus occidentalis TaxID=34638 RepID=A0AAJ6QPM3_9ACAR|nr:NECAP-like protein CG9132 [Galendromus occidentalis]XP_003739730.1 NECAP-like protein CG9132 [Galendromus occidentalis]